MCISNMGYRPNTNSDEMFHQRTANVLYQIEC